MDLFYKDEHTTCYHYKLPTTANFKIEHLPTNENPQLMSIDRSVVLFLLEGEMLVSCDTFKTKTIKTNEMILLPRNSCCYFTVKEVSTTLQCSFIQNIDLCNRFSFSKLSESIPENYTYEMNTLPLRRGIIQFASSLKNCIEDGIGCAHFQNLKREELFILLRTYYSKEELACFFYPLLGKDMDFKDFVLNNFLHVENLSEFASKANMSLDTFKRRFKENFGESAHRWIMQQRANFIYRDLLMTNKPLGDIAFDYNFSSLSYLGKFCQKYFGSSPQDIRNKR